MEARALGNGAGQINMGNQSICWLVGEDNVIVGYRPSIGDGATGVPVNPQLDWIGPATSLLLATHPLDVPIPGHDHITEDAVPSLTQPYNPATLDPNTTYYWQLRHDECCTLEPGMAVGEIWSFTTEDAISTEASTWSQIKALYQ